jgi:translocation and assembly module TamB
MNNDSEHPVPHTKRQRGVLALKIAAWAIGVVVVLIVLAGITITILLHNQRFHDYVLRSAEKQASDSLGVQVTLQNFVLNLSHLSLDLYGLTVDGAAPYADTPLLQVDHAEAGVQVVSILHRKWYLDSFRIDRPIVRVFVDAKGISNLPTFKSSGTSNSNTSIFDLAIRHASLDRGEIYYNDRQSALAADLHDVEFQAAFNSLLQRYSGKLAYSNGNIVSGSLKPISHNLEAVFDATPTTFHLTQAKVTAGPSEISLTATLQNYATPSVDAQYDATIDGMQVGQILENPSIPTGQIRATGYAHYQQATNRSLLEALVVNGDLNSRQLNVKTSSLRTQIINLAAHYSLANGDAVLHDLKLNLLGGQLTGSGTMSNISGDSHSKVNANLRGVSLADLKRLTGNSASTQNVGVEGALNAQIAATWGKTFNDLVAHADATINGVVGRVQSANASAAAIGRDQNASQTGIAIDSAVHGTYTTANGQIALVNSYVRMPQTSLTMNGVVSNRSSLVIRLQADDLREVEALADLFRTPSQGQSLQPLGLAGTASFQGTVQGSTSAPHLTGQFLASNFHVNGSEWKVLRTNVDASPSLVSLQHGDLEPATRGHITFNASTGLSDWSFSDTSPVQIELDASQLSVADLVKLTGQQLPMTGTLAANVHLHGSELNPVGNGSISLAGLVAYDQPVSSVKLTFSGTGDEAHADLAVQLPAGAVQSKVDIQPRQRTFTGQLTTAGINLDKLQALKARNIDATGELALNASGHGSFDNPQLDATLQVPQLVVQNQTITALKLQMNVADRVANAALTTSAVNTNIQAKAKINLAGDYLVDATLDTQAIPFEPLLAVYAPEQAANITGQTEVHATLHGPLKNKSLLEAHVNIPILQMAYGKTVQLAATSPIQIDYKNGVVAFQRATIHGTDTDLQLQGSIPIAGIAAANAPMSLTMLGTVNLQLAQLFDPDVRTSGELKFNVHSTGGASDLGGQIDIVDAAFASDDLPIGLQHGNGALTLTKDRLNITKFEGTIGGGSLTAQGGVALQPSVQFDVGVAAHGIRMLYPQGVRESVNANLRLAGTMDTAVLDGSVNLSDLSFTSAFDLNSFINQFSGGVETPPTPGFGQNLQLNLAVRSTNDINLVSRTLSIDGSANLQVRGTASNPVILGRVNLNSGDIILNGDRYLLDGGTIAFVNPYETEPVVNLSLKTTIQQYDVFLRFNGPIDQLRTNYSSNPALPSADIINLLAFGETTEANSANPSTPANQAAQSLVASQVSSQVTSRVSKIAGISQLSINPVLTNGTNQGSPGANITIQQRVTSNLFVTFSSNVSSTQSQTIQGQYQVSPRLAISATRDQNGGFAVDALIKKTW